MEPIARFAAPTRVAARRVGSGSRYRMAQARTLLRWELRRAGTCSAQGYAGPAPADHLAVVGQRRGPRRDGAEPVAVAVVVDVLRHRHSKA